MGYNTSYRLEWSAVDELTGFKIGTAIGENEEMRYVMGSDGHSEDSGKWYDNEADMRALSLKFPGVLFTLHGEGEESGDVWKKYFRDGKAQICKARLDFPPFDARLLS